MDADIGLRENADADADIGLWENADADADADVEFNADFPRMRMRMRISHTSLPCYQEKAISWGFARLAR